MSMERRRGLREEAATVSVQFCDESERGGRDQRLRKGLVENCSCGGMYISTEDPPDRGKVITLTFQPASGKLPTRLPFEVRATVRWVRQVTSPKGMGVEFLECHGISEEEFKEQIVTMAG